MLQKQEHTVSETHQFYFQQLIWTVAIIFGSPSAVEEFGELVCVSLLSTHCVYMYYYAHDFILSLLHLHNTTLQIVSTQCDIIIMESCSMWGVDYSCIIDE